VKVTKRLPALAALVFLFLAAIAGAAYPHPPKEVILNWNPQGELTVRVIHGVDDPGKHFIFKITVYVDNKMAATREYKSQTDADGLTDTFSLGALPGGTNLKAEASCIIMGTATGSAIVP
jgi:hypothetical protein